jgi:Bifunctional DNA primase/polymerase, N-terminal
MSPATATETTMLDGALKYLTWGWSVIPVGADKRPLVNWKPYQENPATGQEVRDWAQDSRNTSIAIITGAVSRLVVLDVDMKNGGHESLEQLQQEHGRLPQTVTVKTGGGGRHFYFQHPGVSVRPSAGKLGPGLDIRGDGGYVSLPRQSMRVARCTSGSTARRR